MVAEGGTLYHHGVRMARSKELYGPYVTDEMPLLTMRDDINKEYYLQRTGHASLVETQDGHSYVAFLCGRPITDKKRCILGRETCINEVYWNDEGWLRLKNDSVRPSLTYSSYLNEYKFSPNKEKYLFDENKLPHQFKCLRLPLDCMGSLTDRKGYLRLYGQESITSWNNLSLVAKRLQDFHVVSTIKMEFKPDNFQQMAGLTVFYDSYNFFYLYVSRNESENEIRLLIRDNLNFKEPLGSGIPIGDNSVIYLRVEICNLTLQFYYSIDNLIYNKVGNVLDCSNLSDEAYSDIGHEGHTGTFIGMTCQDLSGNKLFADFEYFEYKKIFDEGE